MFRVKLFGRRPPAPLNVFGTIAMSAIVVTAILVDPRPGLSGDGPWVALAVAGLVYGIAFSLPPRSVRPAHRIFALLVLTASMVTLTALQPDGLAFGAVYYIVIVAANRLALVPALLVSGVAVTAECVAIAIRVDEPAGAVISITASVIPWFLVMRLIVRLDRGRDEAEQLVEELRASRAAHAESVAVAEREPRGARHARRARALAVGARAPARGRAADGGGPRERPRGGRGDRARAPPGCRRAGRGARRDRCAARRGAPGP